MYMVIFCTSLVENNVWLFLLDVRAVWRWGLSETNINMRCKFLQIKFDDS